MKCARQQKGHLPPAVRPVSHHRCQAPAGRRLKEIKLGLRATRARRRGCAPEIGPTGVAVLVRRLPRPDDSGRAKSRSRGCDCARGRMDGAPLSAAAYDAVQTMNEALAHAPEDYKA